MPTNDSFHTSVASMPTVQRHRSKHENETPNHLPLISRCRVLPLPAGRKNTSKSSNNASRAKRRSELTSLTTPATCAARTQLSEPSSGSSVNRPSSLSPQVTRHITSMLKLNTAAFKNGLIHCQFVVTISSFLLQVGQRSRKL